MVWIGGLGSELDGCLAFADGLTGNHSFIRSFVRSFIHSFIHLLPLVQSLRVESVAGNHLNKRFSSTSDRRKAEGRLRLSNAQRWSGWRLAARGSHDPGGGRWGGKNNTKKRRGGRRGAGRSREVTDRHWWTTPPNKTGEDWKNGLEGPKPTVIGVLLGGFGRKVDGFRCLVFTWWFFINQGNPSISPQKDAYGHDGDVPGFLKSGRPTFR